MKKQDGYVLIFVLVVLGAVVLFTTIISTAAIRSYQRQAKAESQMEQYFEEKGVHQALAGIITWSDSSVTLKETISTVLSAAGFDMNVCRAVLTTEDVTNPGTYRDISEENLSDITALIIGGAPAPLNIECSITGTADTWIIEYEAFVYGSNIELTPVTVAVQESEVIP